MSLWWPGEWDRLVSKVEDWVVKRHGYSKLQPRLLSRGYQSMMNKRPKNESVCTTFHFAPEDRYDSRVSIVKTTRDSKKYTHKPSSVEVANEIERIPEICLNSLDKMDMVLKQYERAFSKLQKRGPPRSSAVYNRNLDILNEDVIQNIFLKCYNGNRNNHEIATTKV